MSQPKATAETLAQSHIRMNTAEFVSKKSTARHGMPTNLSRIIPVILSVIVIFTAMSCGGGSSAPSTGPVANAGGPYLGNANQALAFNGSGSSAPNGKSLTSYSWNFGDGGSALGVTVSHTYTVAGNYTATLTVTDSSGATGSSNVAVQIITAPVAKPGGPYTGKVGVAVSFNGSASTAPPGQALGFTWNFGDGATATGATPSHTYGNPCTCTVTLTVTDDTAGVSIGTTTATIAAGPAPGGVSPTPSTFFAIGPAANASTQFGYVLTTAQTGVSSLSIETIDTATGELHPTGMTPPPLDGNFIPAGMITDPSHKFLYLYGGISVLSYSISCDTGALTPSGTTATNASPNTAGYQQLIFNPNGKFAFLIAQDPQAADSTTAGSITRFSVDANTGALGTIETVSAQISRPQAAAIDPSGKFLYVSGFAPTPSSDAATAAPRIAVLSVAPDTGALTPISDSPLAIKTEIAATSIAIDSTGRFMFAAGRDSAANSAALSVFTINSATGALTQSSSPLRLGDAVADASSLTLSPSANFGYVFTITARTDAVASETVRLFRWDTQTGASAIGNSAVQYDNVPDPSALFAANLVLFSPTQVDGTSSEKPAQPVFLIVPISNGAPLFGEKLNPNTGAFVWIDAQSSSVGN